MHLSNPSYFVIDLLPIILGILGCAFTKSHQDTIQVLENQISEKDHVINMNAHFAKKIGEGDFSANDEEIDDNDILGHSLKIMRENLAKTNEKEKELNWIAKGKDIISNILRLQNDLGSLSYLTLVELIKYIDVIQAAFEKPHSLLALQVNHYSLHTTDLPAINNEFVYLPLAIPAQPFSP